MVRQTRNSNGTVHRMVADPPAVGGRRGAVTATVTPQRQREEGEDDDARQLRRDEPPARQAPPPARRRTARTVVDFDTEDDLRMALLSMSIQSREDCCEREGAEGRESADDRNDDSMEDPNNMDANMKMTSDDPRLAGLDWCLEDYDRENSIPAPTVQQELERLRNVRSFQMIEHDDQAPKASLNQLSKIAQRLFDVPICTINLMDLGRAWILSGQGVGDIRESGRKETWCR